MRIGIVCPYDIGRPGGVQQLTGELASHLRADGLAVVYVGAGRSWFHGGPGVDEATVPAGRAVSIRANLSQAPVTLSPLAVCRVRRALAPVDVIHVHEPLIPLVSWLALTVDKPLVATFHADPPLWARRVYRRIPRIGKRLRSGILTAVSQVAAEALPPEWGTPRIVPNAIDTGAYDLPVGRVRRRVAFLGRDERRKGLPVLLEAWPRIHEAHGDAELLVMGVDAGPALDGVSFMGRVSGGEKRRRLATSEVFVAPNLGGESFGIVVLEAMAAGCAVVASNLPAFLEVMGDTGVNVPVGDPGAVADAVITLLGDPAEARRLGELGRSRSKRYDWAKVVSAYRATYEEAVS